MAGRASIPFAETPTLPPNTGLPIGVRGLDSARRSSGPPGRGPGRGVGGLLGRELYLAVATSMAGRLVLRSVAMLKPAFTTTAEGGSLVADQGASRDIDPLTSFRWSRRRSPGKIGKMGRLVLGAGYTGKWVLRLANG